ncbi:YfcE family phosphodiesterase [Vaginisenegalia massiliensis]|uniref:YfcE family phosphodiesterase n=1 Tax=Vaginisenegalia massiliensis TaxID=2058294 RepID=UPI000F52B800|nr:metallophosphoesterase [Vaginisenegalia massiliensis]
MKFLLMSDNHGRWQTVSALLERFASQVDYVFHCGDSEFPADDPIWDQIDARVAGNMDFDPNYAKEEWVTTPIGKVLIVHGHHHGVNFGLDKLVAYGQSHGASFIFHGHTHRLHATVVDQILLCNPGSLNHSRGAYDGTSLAMIDINQAGIQVDFLNEEGNLITELSQHFPPLGGDSDD